MWISTGVQMSLEPNASTVYWDSEFDSGLQWCADKEDLRRLLGIPNNQSVPIILEELNQEQFD